MEEASEEVAGGGGGGPVQLKIEGNRGGIVRGGGVGGVRAPGQCLWGGGRVAKSYFFTQRNQGYG